MTIQSEQYTVSNNCTMTYTWNIIIVRTYSLCHNQENRLRKEGMCEITDKSRNPKVTLFGYINLGSKLNPNKTRSWLHTARCTWARSHKKWLTPMNRRWWEIITAKRTSENAYLLMQRPYFMCQILFFTSSHYSTACVGCQLGGLLWYNT